MEQSEYFFLTLKYGWKHNIRVFGVDLILFLNIEMWIHNKGYVFWNRTNSLFEQWKCEYKPNICNYKRVNSLFEYWSMDANTRYVFSNKEGGKKWNWQSEVDFPRGKSWFDHRLAKPVEIDDQIVAELLPINSHFILDYNYWLNTLIPSICSQYFAQILRAYNSSAPSLNRLEQTHFHDKKYILDKVFIFL